MKYLLFVVIALSVVFAVAAMPQSSPGNSHGRFILTNSCGGDPGSGCYSVFVSDTNVTSKSAIQLQYDYSIQTGGQTCAPVYQVPTYIVQSRTPGLGFEVVTNASPINQPFCFTYQITN